MTTKMLMPFGKHKGTCIDELPHGYRMWLIEANILTQGHLRTAIHAQGYDICKAREDEASMRRESARKGQETKKKNKHTRENKLRPISNFLEFNPISCDTIMEFIDHTIGEKHQVFDTPSYSPFDTDMESPEYLERYPGESYDNDNGY